MTSKESILSNSIKLLATQGYEGASIRDVANAAGVQSSVIYHYFQDKEGLFRAVRIHITMLLAQDMQRITANSTGELLREHVRYQFHNRELLVALLQYFIATKNDYPESSDGYVPKQAYQHTRQLIDQGIAEGRYHSSDADFDAKIIAHMINGFAVEYYPHKVSPTESNKIIEGLAVFIERGLGYKTTKTEGVAKI